MNNFIIILQAPNSGLTSFLPIILIIFVFYFFMIRPQINKQREEEKFRSEIKKGDKVVTIGGIHGKVHSIKETQIILEISGNTQIKIEKQSISKEKTIQNKPKKNN